MNSNTTEYRNIDVEVEKFEDGDEIRFYGHKGGPFKVFWVPKEEKMKDVLSVLPAFPSIELTMEQAKRLAQIAKDAREKYEKDEKHLEKDR